MTCLLSPNINFIIFDYCYSLVFDRRSFGRNKDNSASRKNEVPFTMAIGNVELVVKELSLTHPHVNSKNKIRKRHRRRMKEEKSEY